MGEREPHQEKKIPVFTVFKKGILFKNIFLLDKNTSPRLTSHPQSTNEDENEEILLVGRHPHSHIMLEHPSISRFHLQLHLQPSLQKLSVVDLSSAHGTWVSDKKIEPQVLVELREGDVLRLGASTRSYRLHWFPLSCVFDVGNEFVLPEFEKELTPDEKNENLSPSRPPLPEFMNFTLTDDVEEGLSPSLSCSKEERHSPIVEFDQRSENLSPSGPLNEDVEEVFDEWCDSWRLKNENLSPLVLPMPEFRDFRLDDDIEEVLSPTLDRYEEEKHTTVEVFDHMGVLRESFGPLGIESVTLSVENSLGSPIFEDPVLPDDVEEEVLSCSLPRNEDDKDIPVEGSVDGVSLEIIAHQSDKENQENAASISVESVPVVEENQERLPHKLKEESSTPSLWSRRGKCDSLLRIQTAKSKGKNMEIAEDHGAEPENNTEIGDGLTPKVLFSLSDREEDIFTPAKEDYTPRTRVGSKSVKKGGRGEIKPQTLYDSLSSSRDSMSISSDKKNLTQIILYDSRMKKPLYGSRRQEARSTSELPVPMTDSTSSRSVNFYQGQLTPMVLSSGSEGEEEIFTPGKENYTPKTGVELKSIKKGREGELKLQKSYGSVSSSQVTDKAMSTFSDKENLTPIVLHDSRMAKPISGSRQEAETVMSKRSAERVPLQSLVVNSIGHTESEVPVRITNTTFSSSVNCDRTIGTIIPVTAKQSFRETRGWYIVVDTNCLLDKESRRSLKLLQGLKGTQLIIPRIVIRELDCLKRHGSLFRTVTEAAKVLHWIDECMAESKWWIHIQNSMEESHTTLPTPPASIKSSSWSSEGICCLFSRLCSPTAADLVFDCALLFKKIKKDDGRLVLLSNNIALKIRAMAEGLLCETAEEFRDSLVSPYSKRFLWGGSIPTGPTWSLLVDRPLKNSYCRVPVKKTVFKAAEDAKKGLKLLLLDNYSR